MIQHCESYFCGVSLGQVVEASGLVLVGRRLEKGERAPVSSYYIDFMRRFDSGAEYTAIESEIIRLWNLPELLAPKKYLVVNETGVGPILTGLRGHRINLTRITISSGQEIATSEAGKVTVPKTHLVTTLIQAAQRERFKVLKGTNCEKIFFEQLNLVQYRVKKPVGSALTYEQAEMQAPEDLVLAATLALWHAENRVPPSLGRPQSTVQPMFDPFRSQG